MESPEPGVEEHYPDEWQYMKVALILFAITMAEVGIYYVSGAMHAVISAPMPRKTAKTITEPVALWTELKRVREAGVAYDRGEAYEELVCVAAPIRSSGQAIAAVSVTGPAGRMRWNVVTEAVLGTATAIWNANLTLRGADAARR